MVEVSERGGVKVEDIELDLGLSIGGGASFRRSDKPILERGGDTREYEYQTVAVVRSNSTVSPPLALSETESAVVLDPLARREMQALRRQEAKRKREEKKTRAMIGEQPPAKKNGVLSQDFNLINGQAGHHPYPVGPVQYPYAPVQFVPYSNGFAYPCVVPSLPCWPPNGGGFRQFHDLGNNGCNPKHNGKTASLNNGSPICSSSTVSEHDSAASHEGGSSDTRSHSSRLNDPIGKKNKSQSDHTATSHPKESNQNLVIQPKEEPTPEITEPVPIEKPISSNEKPHTPLKATKMEPPKPKAENIKSSNKAPTMPQMPYVSTTGNGPNGKTVHGFLYKYSKSEISIVCVCHGSTFSPAEFVQHAGGAEVSQPLRHITVIPSAFGCC